MAKLKIAALSNDKPVKVTIEVPASVHADLQAYAQALAQFEGIPSNEKSVSPENQFVASFLGWTLAVSGKRPEALAIAKQFEALASRAYVDSYFVAGIYAGLADKDEAFRLLEKGYEQHSAGMQYLTIDSFWYEVRSEPRYADLLRRMGLAQPED